MNREDYQNDNYSGSIYEEGFYSFSEDEIRNASFKVSLYVHRLIPHFIVIFIPVIFYIFAYPLIEGLRCLSMDDRIGTDDVFFFMFYFLIFAIFFLGIALFLVNKGKEIIVSGRGMIIRRLFIFQDALSVDQVYKCEIITGLVSHGKYHTEHFNKAVIYYGEGKKVSFNDNMYKNWVKLVGYMELSGKAEYIDGRSHIQKKLEELTGRR